MKGNDPEFLEAVRLARKFFPEAKAFITAEVGLDWDSFVGAMMSANYVADYSCYAFRYPADPDLGFAEHVGMQDSDQDIYARLLIHTGINPIGRAVVAPDAIGATGWSVEECPPFVCDSQTVPERLDEVDIFNESRDVLFVFESGEALLVDHDQRIHWARSKMNRQWMKK